MYGTNNIKYLTTVGLKIMLHKMNLYHIAVFIQNMLTLWQSLDLCMVSTYVESRLDKMPLLLIFIIDFLDHFIRMRECYQILFLSVALQLKSCLGRSLLWFCIKHNSRHTRENSSERVISS
jgi:hypothetical protein